MKLFLYLKNDPLSLVASCRVYSQNGPKSSCLKDKNVHTILYTHILLQLFHSTYYI